MMRRALGAMVAAALGVGGCYHHETALPGVLDLRSDGRSAPAREEPLDDPYLAREGFAAVLEGDGVHTLGSGVVVEDRAHYVFRFVPVYNTSSTEEVTAALGHDGALRDVSVTEHITTTDISMALVGSALPLVGIALCALTPPLTTTVKGVRIHAGRAPYARNLPGLDDRAPLDTSPRDAHPDTSPATRDEGVPLPGPTTPIAPPPDAAPVDAAHVDGEEAR